MLNKEKQTKEIVEWALNCATLGVDKKTMKVNSCSNMKCDDCYVSYENYPYSQGDCNKNFIHWANSEYVEPKVFTEQERTIIKALDKIKWVARDKDGDVYGYPDKPTKCSFSWSIGKNGYIKFASCTSCEFNSIKWEDTYPTSRAEILGGSEQWKD